MPTPKRLYFKFCEPITTDHYAKADLDDKEKCQALYDQVCLLPRFCQDPEGPHCRYATQLSLEGVTAV